MESGERLPTGELFERCIEAFDETRRPVRSTRSSTLTASPPAVSLTFSNLLLNITILNRAHAPKRCRGR
jgi:hypothetical protein